MNLNSKIYFQSNCQPIADSKNASTNNQSQQIKKGNRTIKNNVSKTKTSKGSDPDESKKIHYVLNPKKIKEKMLEVKETERRAKEKSYQTQSKFYCFLRDFNFDKKCSEGST